MLGYRGFAGQSLWRALRLLSNEGVARKKLVADVSKQAEVNILLDLPEVE